MTSRWVLHLDLDSFFAAAEQLARPTLRGRPVLVGGLGPRGIVAGASGEAKIHGARSAMPMAQARRLCPHAVALPPRTAVYRTLSERFFAVVGAHAPVLERIAYDETFAEPDALVGVDELDVRAFAERVRSEVRERTGLAVSVGAGSGKQVAKIASGLAKPDGVHVVAQGGERALLDPLPVRALWGIGPVAETTLHRAGVETVGALAALDLAEVTALLGVAIGTGLHRLARGIDDRALTARGEAKQVSAETTFDTDLADVASVTAAVDDLTAGAHRRLLAAHRAARTVTVKIRSGAFVTVSRSETAAVATTDLGALVETARRLAVAALPEAGVRLVGVSLSGLTSAVQETLFDDPGAGGAGPVGGDPGGEDPAGAGLGGGGPDNGDPDNGDPDSGDPTGAGLGGGGPVGGDPVGGDPDGVVGRPAAGTVGGQPADGSVSGEPADPPGRIWRTGDDAAHPDHGHGWVQGSGHGRVTVRFETRSTGPGRAMTFAVDEPQLTRADPLASLT